MMRPLEGIRVADFTNHAAGPYCTMLLGQLGAEIVRVESRMRLDIQRRPHPLYGRFDVPNFDYLAGGKKSITLNLKTSGGRTIAQELVRRSDVVVENFRPGVMGRLGLGWDDVKTLNPRAVMLSLSAYGQFGPEGGRPGYAPIFAAEGGLGYMTGYADGAPCEIRNVMDHQSGMTGAFAILAMLEARERDGRGSYIDLAARDVAAMLVGESIVQALHGEPAHRVGNEHELWAPHGVYPASGEDRWVAITVDSDAAWVALVEVMGSPAWASEDLDRATKRLERREEIDSALAEWTATQDAPAIVARLQAAGVPAELSMTAEDILADAHLSARGAVATLSHPEYGERRTVGVPWTFEGSEVVYDRWSPELGEHNEEIICGLLGYSEAELAELIEEGIVH